MLTQFFSQFCPVFLFLLLLCGSVETVEAANVSDMNSK